MGAVISRRALVASCLMLSLHGVSGCRALQSNKEANMRIEIDVYSGRPNPTFELSEPLRGELARMLRDLPRAKRPPPEGGLGYRGFVVTTTDSAEVGLPPRIRVFDGLVIVESDKTTEAYADRNGAEAWLKQQAGSAGYGALFR